MNSSIYSADRTTHLRIVTLALVIGTAIVGFAVSARINTVGAMQASAHSGQVQKAAPANQEAAARTEPRRI
jgi:hypothetical protein